MKVISKNKPKGTEYNALKNMKKAARIVKAKEDRRRAENKRINAEARKERRAENEFYNKIGEISIDTYSKGMLIIEINGVKEKRGLSFGRRTTNLSENIDSIANFQLKLFGEMVELKHLKNFKEKKEELIWAITSK